MWSSSLTIWPNSEFRLLAMTSRTEGRLVRSTTSVFLTYLLTYADMLMSRDDDRITSDIKRDRRPNKQIDASLNGTVLVWIRTSCFPQYSTVPTASGNI